MNEIIKNIEDIRKIKDEKNLSNQEKIDKLKEIEKSDEAKNFTPLIVLIKNHINSPNQNIDKQLEEEKEKIIQKIANSADAIIEEAEQKELIAEIAEETEIPTAEIEDVINGNKTPENASSSDEKKKIEKIKKIYTYKVEGEIKSGIEDLDRFLGIIKPALDQVIIAPWRVIYGIGDAGEWCFEHYKAYQDKQKFIKNAWTSINYLDADNGGLGKFNYAKGNKKNLKTVTDAYHKRWLDKLNERIIEEEFEKNFKKKNYEKISNEIKNNPNYKNIPDDILNTLINSTIKEKLNEFKETPEGKEEKEKIKKDTTLQRTNVFAEDEDPRLARLIIMQDILDQYAKLRQDPKYSKNGKLNEDGSKIIGGLVSAVDLFNKKNKKEFHNAFSRYLGYIFNKDTEIYTIRETNKVENLSAEEWENRATSYFAEEDENNNLGSLLKNLSNNSK